MIGSQKKISTLFGPNVIINTKRTLKLKSITLKINKDCINITTPFFLTNKKIDDLLYKKLNWIKKQLLIQSNIKTLIKKEYMNGEEFRYLGQIYKLQINKGVKYSVRIEENLLIVIVKNINNSIKIKKLINIWFREQSALYFEIKTSFYANKNNLNITSIKVREYKARWGSCSTNGDISFNWRLIMAPPEIIEYVIIHELMHLKEHNHSPKYWKHVKAAYPNIDEAKKWLMYNGKTLNF